MQINVRLAEPFWRAVGQRELKIEIQDSSSVGDLLALLCEHYPALIQELEEAAPMIFIADEEADNQAILKNDDHLHLVWALAGG